MRYTIRRQLSWNTPLAFLDQAGQLAYGADARTFTPLRSTVTISDAANRPVATVHRLPFRIRPGFEVYRGEDRLALIELEAGMRTFFRVELPDGPGLSIRPNSWWTSFDFVGPEGRNAVMTAPLLKHPFPSSSELTIFDERQETLMIAASFVVLKKAYDSFVHFG